MRLLNDWRALLLFFQRLRVFHRFPFKKPENDISGCEESRCNYCCLKRRCEGNAPRAAVRPVSPGFKIGHTPQKFPVSKDGHLLHHRISADCVSGILAPLPTIMPDNDTTQILVLQGFSQYFFKNLRDENQHSIYGYFSQNADKIEECKIKKFFILPAATGQIYNVSSG